MKGKNAREGFVWIRTDDLKVSDFLKGGKYPFGDKNWYKHIYCMDTPIGDWTEYCETGGTQNSKKIFNAWKLTILAHIVTAIKRNRKKGFWAPRYEFVVEKNKLTIKPNATPRKNKYYVTVLDYMAKKFDPKHGSRLGTLDEWFLFIARLLKDGIISMHDLILDSRNIGCYQGKFVPCNYKKVGEFYNLTGNTCRLVTSEDYFYTLVGADYNSPGFYSPKSYKTNFIAGNTMCYFRDDDVEYMPELYNSEYAFETLEIISPWVILTK